MLTSRSITGLALVAALALSGCSGSDDTDGADKASDTSSATSSGSASESSSPYLEVPAGVTLEDQGSELSVGDTATVAWEPRADTIGALDIQVEELEKTTFKSFTGWQLDDVTKQSTPYFVRASVKNVGDTDLSGVPVPLYIVDGTNTLIQASSFATPFKPCASTPLPKKFVGGTKAKVCLVYLAPDRGSLEAVSFRPTQEFDPITWTGKLRGAGDKGKKKKTSQQ